MTLDDVAHRNQPSPMSSARRSLPLPSLIGHSRTELLLPALHLPSLRRPQIPRLQLPEQRPTPAHRATSSSVPYRRVAQSPAQASDLFPVEGPSALAGTVTSSPAPEQPAPAVAPATVIRSAPTATDKDRPRTTTPRSLQAPDPRMTEVLLLVSLTISGLMVCGTARAPWAFWLTSLTPALIAATGWPRSNDDDEVMRFARLSVVALATLVLGTGPAPTVMLVLIWTLAVAPLYPLLLPYRATVLTISVATIILSAPVTLRMLTENYFPEIDLKLLAVLVAATPVVAAVSYTVAQAAAPSRSQETTSNRDTDAAAGSSTEPAPTAAPSAVSSPAPVLGQLPVDDIWLTELRTGGLPEGPDLEPSSHPSEHEEHATAAPHVPSTSARPDRQVGPTDTGTTLLSRARDPNSPWAVSVTDPDHQAESVPPDISPAPRTDTIGAMDDRTDAGVSCSSEADSTRKPDSQNVPTPDALVTTGELLDRITMATSHSEVIGGSAALFLVELEHRTSAPLPARREAVAHIARRLSAGVPAQDAVLRVEENTVALLVGGIDTEGCRAMAHRLSALVEEPVRTAHGPLVTRCAIGIALVDRQVRTSQELVEAASRALDQARRNGSRRWVLHDPALRAHTITRTGLEAGLRQSISDRSIGVVLQPIAGLRPDPGVLRVEALARWRRPDNIPVPPRQFVPLADELGLGPKLGRLVLDQTLEMWTAFRAAGRALPGLSVNVSPAQLEEPDFPSHLTARLRSHHVRPDSFTLELPAAAFLDTEQSRICLAMLRSAGVRLSLDNFGRPGISVNGLSELPIDEVKLDRSLVHGLDRDERLVRSVIALAHSLNLSVVVVGVETTEQLDAATRLGADAVQGHLLAHPQPVEDLDSGITAALRRVRNCHESSALSSVSGGDSAGAPVW